MAKNITLKKYIALFFSGEIVLFFASFISFPIFTRILSKNDYGLMSIMNLTLSLSVVIGSAGIRDAVLRFYSFYKSKGQEISFFATSVIGILLTGSIVAFFLIFVSTVFLVLKKITTSDFYLVIMLVPILYFRIFNFLQKSFLRIQEKARATVVIDVILRYGAVFLSIIFVMLWKNTAGFFAGVIFSEMFIFIYFLKKKECSLNKRLFDREIFKTSVLFGLPLMADNLVSYFLSGGDRYIITYFLGPGEVANYSVAYNYCEYPLTIIRNALLYSFMPMIFNYWNAGKKNAVQTELNRYFKIYVWVAAPVIFGVSAVAPYGIILLAGGQYDGLTGLVPIIVAGVVLNGMNFVVSAGLILAKKTMTMLKITLSATLLNLALNIIVVPFLGLYGAAITTFVTYLFYFLLSMFLSRKEFKFPIPYIDIFQAIFCGFAMYILIKIVPVKFLPILVGQILVGVSAYIVLLACFWRRNLFVFLREQFDLK